MNIIPAIALLVAHHGGLQKTEIKLLPGDPAPKISARSWFNGAPVAKFERGSTYVLDFWATWCKPCVDGFGLLTDMEKRYGKKIKVIGVNVWEEEPQQLSTFLKRHASDLAYSVATDTVEPFPENVENKALFAQKHGKTSLDWMVASGNFGIPTVFVVDGKGKIAWIGDPEDLGAVLPKVLSGTFDTQSHRKTYLAAKRKELADHGR